MDLTPHRSNFEYRDLLANKRMECIDNALHNYLYGMGVRGGKLIRFNCPYPYLSVGAEDVNGISLDGYPLETWLAKWQAVFLAKSGLVLSTGFIGNHLEFLVSSYCLNTSLCVVEYTSGGQWEYSFVTKSPAVLREHEFQMLSAHRQKWYNSFSDRFLTSIKELEGSFSTVSIFSVEGGVSLAKKTIKADSARYLLPYYVVENYSRGLRRVLNRRKVRLTFRGPDGLYPPLVTSLAAEIVAHWLGISLAEAEVAKQAEYYAPFSGYIALPDLMHPGQFVSVPVLHIEKLEFL